MTGESTTGTADDAAAARDNGTLSRSEQSTLNAFWVNGQSVAGRKVGGRRDDEGAVAAIEIAEGRTVEQDLVENWAASSERPQPVEDRSPQDFGEKARLMISPWTSRLRKRCS